MAFGKQQRLVAGGEVFGHQVVDGAAGHPHGVPEHPLCFEVGEADAHHFHPDLRQSGIVCQRRADRCAQRIEPAIEHISHLDTQATYYGMSRAAYLRTLIVRDVERQGPARVATA